MALSREQGGFDEGAATFRQVADMATQAAAAEYTVPAAVYENMGIAPRVRDERGSLVWKTGGIATAAMLVAGVASRAFGFDFGLDLNAEAQVTDVSVGITRLTPLAEACWLDYGTIVNDNAELRVEASLGPLHSPDFKWGQRMTGATYGNKVCNEQAEMKLNKEGDTYYVSMADDTAFKVTVYRTNPMDNVFTPDPNALAGFFGGVEQMLDGLPGIDPHGINSVDDALKAIDEVVAVRASADVCGPKAWDAAQAGIKDKIEESVLEDLKQADVVDDDATSEDVKIVVKLPAKPTFASQYDFSSKELSDTDGLTVEVPHLTPDDCNTDQLATATPTPGATS